jgi:hypothetical protein
MEKRSHPDDLDPATSDPLPSDQQALAAAEPPGHVEYLSARKTIFGQAVSGLVSLVVGGSIIALLAFLSNKLELFYSDSSRHYFFIGPLVSTLGLLIGVPYVIWKQFNEALNPDESFRVSMQTLVLGCSFVLVISLIFIVPPLLLKDWAWFLIVLLELTVLTLSFISISYITGLVQARRLKLEAFDPEKHRVLISNQTSVAACKSGILPYQARVSGFWRAAAAVLFALGFIGLTIFVVSGGSPDSRIPFLVTVGLSLMGIFRIIEVIDFLKSPQIRSIEGVVANKTSESSITGIHYHIICGNRSFTTGAKTWEAIFKGCKHRLWYSARNNRVVAFELLEPKPNFDPEKRAQDLEHIRDHWHTILVEAVHKGLNGPVWQAGKPGDFYYTFRVPIKDGSFYSAPRVLVQLSLERQQILKNKLQSELLVQRIIRTLTAIPDTDEPYHLIQSVTDYWPFLVALGGEIVPLFVTVAHKSGNVTVQALVGQLLGTIAQEASARLSEHSSTLLCQDCFTLYRSHQIDLPWLETDIIHYYGCRTCGRSRDFLKHPGEVVAVLDARMEALYQPGEPLRVNWLTHRKLFDFDRVEIIQATDEDVERFAVQVGNDTDEVRRPRYKRMPCFISPDCQLSQNTIWILRQMFGQVLNTIK